ncbi:MAG TPA: SgcJ/EcaC family oxidoreductase [Candidatus Acidoferrum sp.]|nr:SgcJ/EcaC family oxidoreductase [Candidatus Acidoferrum sp.]
MASGQAGWNKHDAVAMDKDFVDDCDFVNVFGEWISGHEKLVRIHTALFAGPLRESYMRMTVEKIRFVRPDLAIVHVRERNTDRDGKPLEGDEGNRLLLVMSKERGKWWILAGQNTQVKPLPEAFKLGNSPAP